MKLHKCLEKAVKMVLHAKLRSWLTIVGIVIGVASVISLVSIGEGMQASVSEDLGSLGGNTIEITSGYSKATSQRGPSGFGSKVGQTTDSLGTKEVQALKSIRGIDYIDTNIKGHVEVYYLGGSADLSLTGVNQKFWSYVTTSSLEDGRMLDSADQNVVVIGYKIATKYFDDPIGINKVITIEDSSFRVVGILEESSGFGSSDNSIYMPLQSAYQVLDDKTTDEYDSITLLVDDESDIDEIVGKVESKLNIVRHVHTIDDKDFTVTSMKQIYEQISSITGTVTLFLGLIATISLIVGAVGIANTMFTAVLEKTKEIGIMKSIGAKNKDILWIFLFHAGVVGLIGGLIGVLFGIGISSILSGVVSTPDGAAVQTVVSINTVLLALSISLLAGLIAGFVPAYQGSKLKPVDALRYE